MIIRNIVGDMPFDRDGKHATGRKIWGQAAAGNWVWLPEFEGDDTVNLPTTESAEDFRKRLWDLE